MFVFFLVQLAMILDHRKRSKPGENKKDLQNFQMILFGGFALALAVVVALLWPTGYFGPLSSRVRGLFVQHTRTGNPLVDSVAEHQATRDEMYFQFFHSICYLGPLGMVFCLWKRSEAKYFILVYALVAMYFSRKMNRLVLLVAPAASVLGGVAISGICGWCADQVREIIDPPKRDAASPPKPSSRATANAATATSAAAAPATPGKKAERRAAKAGPNSAKKASAASASDSSSLLSDMDSFAPFIELKKAVQTSYDSNPLGRLALALVFSFMLLRNLAGFWHHSHEMSKMLSNPSIILKANTRSGEVVVLDDFREAYWWIRDNTPEDARVMSWWDYGYQISQIANRTTLADGNTWNHEHIALLGKCLVSPVKESHKIVRHLADYVLVWSTRFAGNPGDDIAKSPHMARIGGSVYKDVRPELYYQDQRTGEPSKMMKESLVYNLVLNNLDPKVGSLPRGTYEEVYTSKQKMVRVYKVLDVDTDSKAYSAENRGYKAWLAGEPQLDMYPPALQTILAQKQDFAQLEDFNVKKSGKKQ